MTAKHPIRAAIIGTGHRSSYLYGPLIKAVPGQVELVSILGRSTDSARRLGESLGVPWDTDRVGPDSNQLGLTQLSIG